jgi:hypothetical protein
MKRCSCCKEEKDCSEFNKDKSRKDGLSYICKNCDAIKGRGFKNRMINEGKCRDCGSIKKDKTKRLCEECGNKMLKHKKEYSSKPETKQRINKYSQERRDNDLGYRLMCNLRSRPTKMLKGKVRSMSRIGGVGCTPEELVIYMENQWMEGMSWSNYGNGPGKWNVDHVYPFCLCDHNNPEEIIKNSHYTNLRPLWWEDNISRTYEEFTQKPENGV